MNSSLNKSKVYFPIKSVQEDQRLSNTTGVSSAFFQAATLGFAFMLLGSQFAHTQKKKTVKDKGASSSVVLMQAWIHSFYLKRYSQHNIIRSIN